MSLRRSAGATADGDGDAAGWREVTQTLTCPAGQNPANCGTVAVTGQVQSVTVSEPNLPEGWVLTRASATRLGALL
jgi:hypothetical protein